MKSSPPYLTNNDLWEEILIRIPVDDVHHFKCVSKRYLSIISHPTFIRRYINYRATNYPQQLEHYLHYYDSLGEGGFLELKLPNQTPQPQLFSSPNLLPSSGYDLNYIPIVRDCPRDKALQEKYCLSECTVVSASHGLALCRAYLKTGHYPPVYPRDYPRVFYVCNPLTKQWVELPHCNARRPGPLVLACHPKSDSSVNEVDFTVLEIEGEGTNLEAGYFYTQVFSSVTGCWTEHKVDCPRELDWFHCNGVVFYNGMFYWYTEVCVVEYDPINSPNKCNFISLPSDSSEIDRDERIVYHCQGKLLLATTYYKCCVVWELVDGVKGKWDPIYDFPLSHYNVAFFSQFNKEIVCLECHRTEELVLYNMKKRSVERVMAFPFVTTDTPIRFYDIPFNTTSWPTHVPLFLPKVQDE